MTDDTERLAQIRARVEAATDGPWEMADMAELGARRYAVHAKGTYIFSNAWREHDTDFIAASRDDVPYLLDLVASLQDALADNFPATWDGFIAFLNRVYPEDIFTDTDKQPGSQMVWMARRLASLTADLELADNTRASLALAWQVTRHDLETVAAERDALWAAVKEARREIESWPVNDRLEIVANEAAVLAILARGLKGSEE